MLRLALEVAGHRVLEAADEPEAVRMLQRHRPALVLTDLKLPRGDGFGVLRAAKACDPQMPVVLLTAYGARARRRAGDARRRPRLPRQAGRSRSPAV